MLAKPDPATFQVLPWRSETPGSARMFCDILMPDGSPSFADPRYVLKRALAKASDLGFTFYTHPEIEFFLLEGPPEPAARAPIPIDSGGYFDHTPHGVGHDFRRDAITMLESMGISVEFSHHEGAPGQQEIDLRYADALSTADNIMTFRLVMKEVALEQGIYATFMPKPFTEHPGSGMHTHLSLFEGDRNAFFEAGARVPALQGRPGVHRRACCGTPPRSPRSPTSGSTPTSGSGAAGAPRAGGEALVRLLGSQQPLRPGPGADVQAAQGRLDPRGVPLARTPRATPTSPSRSSSRPGSRASRRATSWPRAPRTTCGSSPTRSAVRWASSRCRPTWPTRSGRWSAASWSPRPTRPAPPKLLAVTGGTAPAADPVPAEQAGTLEKDEIRRAIRHVVPALKQCYGRLLEDEPQTWVGWCSSSPSPPTRAPAAAGSPEASIVPQTADAGAPELIAPLTEQCMLNAIARASFPAPPRWSGDGAVPVQLRPQRRPRPGNRPARTRPVALNRERAEAGVMPSTLLALVGSREVATRFAGYQRLTVRSARSGWRSCSASR